MAQFFFNDCLPTGTSCDVEETFSDVISDFLRLRKEDGLQIDRTLVIGELPENTPICGISLKEILSRYKGSREEKNAVIALFRNAIVLSNQWDDFVNPDNIYKEFSFNNRDAHYLAVASFNKLIALSLPIEDQLKTDTLEVSVFDTLSHVIESSVCITNWFKDNTNNIRKQLLPHAETQLDELSNLFHGIGKNVVFSEKFVDQWNYEINNDNFKERIIKRFEEAYKGKLLFPAKDDPREPKYKNVRKDNQNTNVFELRLRDTGVRVYFVCDINTIKIIFYGTKTSHYGHGQESDFRIANELLKKM